MGTLGKYAFGIRLVNRSFSQPSYKQMFTRWLMTIPSALVLGGGFFSVGWHPKKQGWHDRVAKTVVVTKSAIRLKSTKKGTQNKNAA